MSGRPAVASLEPVPPLAPPSAPAAEEAEEESDMSAAALLERGFAYFRKEKPEKAGEAFRAALETGSLNDAGRTLAYWHIFLAARSTGDIDASAEALASFLSVGQDVLEARAMVRYAVDEGGDFVERFDLVRRMTRARAILSAIWATRVPEFGRSAEHPVPVRSDNELLLFLELAPPCRDAPDRRVSRNANVEHDRVVTEHVTVRCGADGPSVDYFFQKNESPQ